MAGDGLRLVCDKRGDLKTRFGLPEGYYYATPTNVIAGIARWKCIPPKAVTSPAPAPQPVPTPSPIGDIGAEFSFTTFGNPLPIIYGSYVTEGSVFWHSGFTQHKVTIDGAPANLYSTNFALGLCEGPIDDVLRIWVDEKLVYDNRINVDENGAAVADAAGVLSRATINALSPDSPIKSAPASVGTTRITIFNGGPNQLPNLAMAEVEGYENSPGYRGTAFILFENFFTGVSNAPNIRVEVLAASNPTYAYTLGQAEDNGVFLGDVDVSITLDPVLGVIYVGAIGASMGGGDETDGWVSYDTRDLSYIGDHRFFNRFSTENGGDVDQPNYRVTSILSGGNILASDNVGNPGRLVVGSPWSNTGISSIGGGGISGHNSDGPCAVGLGTITQPDLDAEGNGVDLVFVTSQLQGVNAYGFAAVYPDGRMTWHGFENSVLAEDAGTLSTDTENRAVFVVVRSDMAASYPTFEDGRSSEGGHVYTFTLNSPPDQYLYIDRVTYDDVYLDPAVTIDNPEHSFVKKVSLDYIGGLGRNHEIINIFLDPYDLGVVMTFKIEAGSAEEADRIVKYDPFSGGFYYNKPLPVSLDPTTCRANGNIQIGIDRLWGWVSTNDEACLTDLRTGDTTVVIPDLVAAGLPSADDLESESVWLGDEGALVYFVSKEFGQTNLAKVWLTRKARGTTLVSDVIKDLLRRAGWNNANTEIDNGVGALSTLGYAITSGRDVRAAIAELKQIYTFDVVESDGKVLYRGRGSSSSLTVPHTLLKQTDNDGYLIETIDTDVARLRKLAIEYQDYDRDYQENIQTIALPKTNADAIDAAAYIDVKAPVVLTAQDAKELAELLIYQKTVHETTYEFSLPARYHKLDPGDVITVDDDGESLVMRVREVTIGDDKEMRIRATKEDPDIYNDVLTLFGVEARFNDIFIPEFDPAVVVYALRMPTPSYALSEYLDSIGTHAIYYMIVSPKGDDLAFTKTITFTTGAVSEIAIDPGVAPTWGYVTVSPNTTGSLYSTDNDSTLTVKLVNQGELVLASADNGEQDLVDFEAVNLCYVNGEILKFTTAVTNMDGTVTLTGLHRALYGTDQAARSHAGGGIFMLLADKAALNADPIDYAVNLFDETQGPNRSVLVNIETTNPRQPSFTFNYESTNIKPLSPGAAMGEYVGDDAVLTWNYRSRRNENWPDDGTELVASVDGTGTYNTNWEVYLTDAPVTGFDPPTTFLRTFFIPDAETFTYTDAMQVEDGFDRDADTLYAYVRFSGGRNGLETGTPAKFAVYPVQ